MAVQKSKKSKSKRGMRRANDFLSTPATSINPSSGERHFRHHMTPSGLYKNERIVPEKPQQTEKSQGEE